MLLLFLGYFDCFGQGNRHAIYRVLPPYYDVVSRAGFRVFLFQLPYATGKMTDPVVEEKRRKGRYMCVLLI